ncbi:MAG: hypothetical protein M3463_12925 [Verrucomicrobiota bacterium]|nr:hypothetical protein [Verrucomicrobiota bacterium]
MKLTQRRSAATCGWSPERTPRGLPRPGAPVQHLESVEVPGGVNQGQSPGERLRFSPPKANGRIGPLDPLPVGFVQVDRGIIEGAAPLEQPIA